MSVSSPIALDFFTGSGLVTEGLKGRFDVVWANDNSAKKVRTYEANHGAGTCTLEDIARIDGAALPEATLAWGSFPCQDLSLAGKMAGLNSPRSGLFWQWLRVLDEMAGLPPILVAENVVGLVSSSGGEHYRVLHNALAERGYRTGAVMLDAASWIPQSRRRVFVIAVDPSLRTDQFEGAGPDFLHPSALVKAAMDLEGWVWWSLPQPSGERPQLQDILEPDAPVHPPEQNRKLLDLIPPAHRIRMQQALGDDPMYFPGYKRIRKGKQVLELRFDGLAGALRTPSGGSSRQFVVIRRGARFDSRLLTARETARLMGAEDHYKLPGSYNDAYYAMGDAVAVPVTRYLAEHLLYSLVVQTKVTGEAAA